MKDWGVETYIALIMFVSGAIGFFWKSAKKVENTDINLGHEVEKNKAELVRLNAQVLEEKMRLNAQIAEDNKKFEERLLKIENVIIDKAVRDALLAQNVEHISKSVDEIKQMNNDVLSKMLGLLIVIEKKGGGL
jgi:hypothetical protein